jgi:hypothetical protein
MATDPTTGQNIFGKYHVGIHNVGSYQVSGIPWITGSALVDGEEQKISFPMVSKSITIIASGAFGAGHMIVSFAPSGSAASPVAVAHRYMTMNSEEDAYTFNVKAKEIYVSATGNAAGIGYECVAELTNIPAAGMYTHTGSGISDSA